MRAGGPAGRANQRYSLTTAHSVACFYQQFAGVAIEGLKAIAVVDDYIIAITAGPAGAYYFAGLGRIDRITALIPDVHSAVSPAVVLSDSFADDRPEQFGAGF